MNATANTELHHDGRWIRGTALGYHVEALAFAETSVYGMPEDARISKLWIAAGAPGAPWVPVYDYDRNDLFVAEIDAFDLERIIAAVTAEIPAA